MYCNFEVPLASAWRKTSKLSRYNEINISTCDTKSGKHSGNTEDERFSFLYTVYLSEFSLLLDAKQNAVRVMQKTCDVEGPWHPHVLLRRLHSNVA